MNVKSVTSPDDQDPMLKQKFFRFKGADVLLPLDCPDNILEDAVTMAKKLQSDHKIENSHETDYAKVAEELKKHMDAQYSPYWHVVCGKNFGCYAVHESRNFMFFTFEGPISFLLYKAS